MLRDIFKIIVVGATLLLNGFLVWVLLYNPFSAVLLDKNQPYHDPPYSVAILLITLAVMLLLIGSSLYLVLRFFTRHKLFFYAPLFSLLVILILLIIKKNSIQYPSSISYETKNGHFYINEIWWNQPDHKRIFKRWKSVQPYNEKLDPTGKILLDTSIKYTLDSISESLETNSTAHNN
jgi:hypothetical protein